jgi:hypothetical protein
MEDRISIQKGFLGHFWILRLPHFQVGLGKPWLLCIVGKDSECSLWKGDESIMRLS